MENNDFRAKQFLAFDALDGFREIISNCNIIKFDKIIRGEDLNEELDRIINKLKIGDMISIRYYCGMQYIESIGRVKKIDFFKTRKLGKKNSKSRGNAVREESEIKRRMK